MKTFAEKVIAFNRSLDIAIPLPKGVSAMNPYAERESLKLSSSFYHKYYADTDPRFVIVGINPGRFGGGLTGVPFTDPYQLQVHCGIQNSLEKREELSANFIYRMINRYGGPEAFFKLLFISAVCPLGFVKDGKNLNYYDMPSLTKAAEPFIIQTLKQQLTLGILTNVCFCLGEGANYKYLSRINDRFGFFKKIVPLPHPRYIMQYKRKQLDFYIDSYIESFAINTA